MDSLKLSLRLYWPAVAMHWWYLLGAGLLTLMGLIQGVFPNWSIPVWLWLAGAFAMVSVAQFMAFHRVRCERDALQRLNVDHAALERVADFRHRLIKLQNEPPGNDVGLGQWIERYKQLRNEIIEGLKADFGTAEALLFTRIGTFQLQFMPRDGPQSNPEHIRQRSMLIRDHKWLDDLAKDYGRKRRRSEHQGSDSP